MSTLTKAFVVLVTVLSVVLVALVVPFVAQTENHAELLKAKDLQLNAARVEAEAIVAEIKLVNADLAQANTVNQNSLNEANRLLAEERESRTDESARIAELETDLATQKAANLTMASALESQNAQLADQASLINDTLTDNAAAVARERETQIALEESRGYAQRLRNQVDRLAEQLKANEAELQEASTTIEQQAKIIEDSGLGIADGTQPNVPIDGSITSIDDIGGGITLVEINVGSRDNVAEGMSFTVSRGDEYVGVITIQAVDTANAVGQVVRNSSDLRAGDRVAAGR